MKYMELSLTELNKCCYNWAKELDRQCDVDLIVYIAKAGFIIGEIMSEVMEVPLIGIAATRKGNYVKEKIGPLFSRLPNRIRNFFITIELKSNTHGKSNERNVSFHKSIENIEHEKIHNVLIVDDSVDTGYSMKEVYNKVSREFDGARIYTAALNVWNKSLDEIKTDYALFKNTVIKTPMSKDSKEYDEFLNIYMEGTKNEYV